MKATVEDFLSDLRFQSPLPVCLLTCLRTRQHLPSKATCLCSRDAHPAPLCTPSTPESATQTAGVDNIHTILLLLWLLLLLLVDDLQ
jgi:hypothetical protein